MNSFDLFQFAGVAPVVMVELAFATTKKLKRIFTGWLDELIAADPGFSRLKSAARATLTVTAMVGVINLLELLTGKPIQNFFIGVVVSMISTFAVTDSDRKQKMITMALIPLPSIMAASLGSLLSGSAYISESVFVVIMFLAVYIRRFGPRWFAFGMIMFISYFFVIFLKVKPQGLPWMFLAIFCGAAVSFLFRFVIITDARRYSASTVMPAVRARLRLILNQFRAGLSNPKKMRHHYNRMRRQEVYLNEITLLDVGEREDESWDESFFEIDLAAQHLTELGRNNQLRGVEDENKNFISDIDRVILELKKKTPCASQKLEWSMKAENQVLGLLKNLLDAVSNAGPSQSREEIPEASASQTDDGANQKLLPTTRQAIQVAIASIIAIAGGELLSSRRWYWAVITAFIVFTGTSTRGHVFVKSWQRVAGTFFGVGVGILIAALVDGNQFISLILIFLSIFLGFYFRSISYAIMIFWITILLALLYGLLGFFSIDLLSLRLEETLVGAAAGIVVAVFLFPTKTHKVALSRSQDFLTVLSKLIGESTEQLQKPNQESLIAERLRDLDNAFQELRQAARPLTFRIHKFKGPRTSQRWLRVMLLLRYQAHVLARLARTNSSNDQAGIEHFTNFSNHIRAQIKQLSLAIENTVPRKKTLKNIENLSAENPVPINQDTETAYGKCLKKMKYILNMLARDMGS